MPRPSVPEVEFKSRFPYANVRPSGRKYRPFEVYAGDYLCADGATKREAFANALEYAVNNLITPDPNEMPTGGVL